MKIRRNLLHADDGTQCAFQRSPNQGGRLSPRYLVMHYTAGANADSAIAHMLKPTAKVSAHLVIARDGTMTQLVPFNKIAWHAGQSRWHGLVGLNRHAIGIELDNAGKLKMQGGEWRSWFGRTYAEPDVAVATHMHDDVERGWHIYSEAQLTAATGAAQAIVAHYGLADVLGHDDIAPNRKFDPGPAFPMESFRASVTGRDNDAPLAFTTRSQLNIRSGPGTGRDKLRPEPLDKGQRLLVLSRHGSWCQVEVIDDDDQPDLTGWVHGDYIEPAS